MKVPQWFQKLYWWGYASTLNIEEHKRTIIVQIVNYGGWAQWKWMARVYGRVRLQRIIEKIPASEFRPSALKLLCLLLGIRHIKYASRSDYIKAKRNS